MYALGGGLTQPIFHGGALRGALAYSKARQTELLSSYHKTVLTAFSNVEGALVAVRQTADQLQRQQDAVAKAQRAYRVRADADVRRNRQHLDRAQYRKRTLQRRRMRWCRSNISHLQALVNLIHRAGRRLASRMTYR